ncbi:MAG: hypothetical protein ABGX27_06235 [Desulfurobacteriaceae bacterium]
MESCSMIGVDVGSSKVKWFDGKNFGFGNLKGKREIVGITSRNLYVKKAFYPICKGSQLKKLVINDVLSELDTAENEVSVAFCPIGKKEKGCEFLVFVLKKEEIEQFESANTLTLDIAGTINAVSLLYGEEKITVVDAGAGKVSVIQFEKGIVDNIEIIRSGFPFLLKDTSFFRDRVVPFLKGKVLLVGGGALNEKFLELFKKFCPSLEIPNIEPFGKDTPIFFNAFGLYHFRKSPCKPTFKEFSIFSSKFWTEHKTAILFSIASLLASGFFYTASLVLSFLAEKKDYRLTLKEYKRTVESIINEKALAPKLQVSQKYSKVQELKDFFLLNKPSVLFPIEKIGKSIDPLVKILKIEGSIESENFSILGVASSEKDLDKFREKLSSYFEKITVNKVKKVEKGIQFTMSLSGVKR